MHADTTHYAHPLAQRDMAEAYHRRVVVDANSPAIIDTIIAAEAKAQRLTPPQTRSRSVTSLYELRRGMK